MQSRRLYLIGPIVAALLGCREGPSRSARFAVSIVPDPVVGHWEPNVPKFPDPFVPGVHLVGQFCVHIKESGGRAGVLESIAVRQGGSTGVAYYHGSVVVLGHGSAVTCPEGPVTREGPFEIEVQLVDDTGTRYTARAASQVIAPTEDGAGVAPAEQRVGADGALRLAASSAPQRNPVSG